MFKDLQHKHPSNKRTFDTVIYIIYTLKTVCKVTNRHHGVYKKPKIYSQPLDLHTMITLVAGLYCICFICTLIHFKCQNIVK